MPRYVVGIDLGTTNCALAYADLKETGPELKVKVFQIPQLVGAGRIGKRETLPSFLYLPGEIEAEEDLGLPWDSSRRFVVGTYARDHGALVPSRLVSSAKSWLCHGGVDRTAKILPWGSGEDVEKVSPVEASARYLEHLKEAWNYEIAKDDPEKRLENQVVILTVPASFDEVARELTLKAAEIAGLQVVLLEEPTAALYAWLSQNEKDWHEKLKPGEHVLICDIGGGTSDFTVVEVREGQEGPYLERIAVGDHILLGGDNIDLALAKLAEKKLPTKRLDFARFQTLTFLCRELKERLLSPDGPEEDAVRLTGRGRALIADTLVARITREEVLSLILKDFFPEVAFNQTLARVESVPRGMRDWGLPYAREQAITRHLGAFLYKNKIEKIDVILFNGGALKPPILRERLKGEVARWFNLSSLKVLETTSLDLAVAIGAAYYGLVREGLGIRVGGGLPRAYYLGVEEGDKTKAVCLAPKGLKEGEKIELPKTFKVLTNRPVKFPLYTSSTRKDSLGDVVELDESFAELPPLSTTLKFGRKTGLKEIPVRIEVFLSEVGVLEIYCCSLETPHRWRLQFNLRSQEKKVAQEPEGVIVAKKAETEPPPVEKEKIEMARHLIKTAFEKDAQILSQIMNLLEEAFEMERDRWPTVLIRELADFLIENKHWRPKSAAHEARWFNLLGFFLRPGYGDVSDPFRLRKIWGLYFEGVNHKRDKAVQLEWWIFWRRVAGGLSRGKQEQLFAKIKPFVLPSQGKKAPSISPQERREIWLCVANLERLSPEVKYELAQKVLPQVLKKNDRLFIFVLSRLLARILLYGPADAVVPPGKAKPLVEEILSRLKKQKTSEKITRLWAEALINIGRLSGDRALDLPEETRLAIKELLASWDVPMENYLPLEKVVEIEETQRTKLFGEALPLGLKVHD
ncbi:Hsp70 family protein [Thermodesulfatator autotrophicus]|uniref:Molecular chaperone DnaK n=1 Tax=Thermodesulfatator autotrophicus TaxID=1795632 RepID=A0A177EBG5_9BACT|nr:Hsp70 family protein [Thermodesulfatator autotrophicus]OAG28522.1 hypothetical protein TH606_01450 [Thermodesulfatator autotrophicus]